MRTGAARDHVGYFHETAFYRDDEDFLGLVVPFLEEGLRAGEPTLVACGAANERLLRAALSDVRGITFLPGADQYARPTEAILNYRRMFADHAAAGVAQIRVIGDVPHPGTGAPWDWWARYEAAANRVFGEFPLWGLCPYDLRTTPAEVVDDVLRTHPHVARPDGQHLANPGFDPFGRWPAWRPHPLQSRPPRVELLDPSPAEARRAVERVCDGVALGEDERDDIVYAASEAVTNGLCHGKPPVRLRVWADAARVVVAVTDGGPGPEDPLVGLVPTEDSASGGLGLWIAHRTCRDVAMTHDEEGYTIRFTAGVL
ncbi:anti-sigma regulatory factor (Ser/Thr protein kinase) [Saccharothrix coeruleofusca]|uniref:sensor histidine kinase n=1 Tax=Saccharothrix coeruleofusca TaxID=33919 RepID=UPI001AEB9420|nr:sensor histidine kinase [Saccharothrix coeruleofusca]MBP2334412.1 anti-sigma regulatory factor (Ser/Thr protein kinase) [Saccharothrix coeruleofusca]